VTPLPIDQYLPTIIAQARERRALVLVAEPGAGKTTRVPPALLRAGILGAQHPNLVMLQPRRVAARASAERIADENRWTLGREVGYHVRFDRKITDQTRLRVLTEGILTRQLLDDPFLEGVGAVILDEFHERSLHTDIAAALLREVQQTVREDLILIVMSATLEAEPVARFLGGCPIVRVEGRTFPVAIEYRGQPAGAAKASLPDRVAAAVHDVIAGGPDGGDVLAFLPGAEEIRRTGRHLESLARERDLLVLPLHGSLPAEEQTRALRPADRRKVILATNIAETSLTIEGVDTVVDSGLARVAGYDPQRGLDRLELQRISKASATQRAGRAGRTGPGRCMRLWSQRDELAMADFELPEVRRVDLCGTVLALHAWGKSDPRQFGWYEPPPEETLVAAERLLEMLGALDGGAITDVGRQLMTVPAHPRLGRLLLAAAQAGALEEGAALAALLSEKDIVAIDTSTPFRDRGPSTQGASDLLVRLELLDRAERSHFAAHLRSEGIDPVAARSAARLRGELFRQARRLPARPRKRHDSGGPPSIPSPGTPGEGQGGGSLGGRPMDRPLPNPPPEYRGREKSPPDEPTLLKLPLYAYPDRVVRRRDKDPSAGVMVGGGGVRLAPESIVRQGEFFVAVDARHDQRSAAREAMVRIASRVEPEWLEELFPNEVRRERSVVYDAERDRVVARGVTAYRDLVLREDKDAPVDPRQAAEALAEAARPHAAVIFESDEGASEWLARLALLQKAMPEHAWPEMNPDGLADLLGSATQGKRSIAELQRIPLVPLLQGRLEYPLDRLFEQQAPETLTVPSGSRIRLSYAKGDRPVLAVRLQELFGWADTPRVAGGRVPVLIHLLAPNYRPVQITDDLRSFWSTTYFQVRKDLRVRYPKHAWPDDPLTATPEAKGRRRNA
jgi:ATP-dependent helicase HrpB